MHWVHNQFKIQVCLPYKLTYNPFCDVHKVKDKLVIFSVAMVILGPSDHVS
jgi:hypothetical protein